MTLTGAHLACGLAAGWLLDLAIGDPRWTHPFHPILHIGRLVGFLARALNPKGASNGAKLALGLLLWLVVVGATFGLTFAAWKLLSDKQPYLALALWVFVCWATIATKDLDVHVRRVATHLAEGDLPKARYALSMIVGRDTQNLDEGEISRGAFETMAENSSDGVVAPIFYLALGGALGLGPALGLAYKAVNTLDSMVGYKNEKYLHFGRVSARMDDAFNFFPARLTALLAALCATLLFATGFRSLKAAATEGSHHASPNSGYPEAAFAGAVGVRLGGTNVYGGVERKASEILPHFPKPDRSSIFRGLKLLWLVSLLTLALATLPLVLSPLG